MINPNYRYVHLARLIQIVNGPLPGMQAIRRLDQTFGTTYFNDIFHGRQWPAYVRWFGLEDHLADIATDYAAEIYDADDFGDWLNSQKKIKSGDIDEFTPTQNPHLRNELSLDQFENSWLFGVNRTDLRRELSKNNMTQSVSYQFLGYETRMNLTYALFARRRVGADKLFSFCLARAIWYELNLKLFELPRAGQFHPVPSLELLTIGEPMETILDVLQPSIAWSFDEDAPNWFNEGTIFSLNQMLAFAVSVQAGGWPDRAISENMLQLMIGQSVKGTLLQICAPALFSAMIEP